MEAKYIIWNDHGTETTFIFPSFLIHSDVAVQLGILLLIISAGMVQINQIDGRPEAYAYGGSISLKVRTRTEKDSYHLNQTLRIGRFFNSH